MAKKAVATFKKGDGRTYSKVIKMVKSPTKLRKYFICNQLYFQKFRVQKKLPSALSERSLLYSLLFATKKGDGRTYSKVIKMVKSPKTGAYIFQEEMIPNEAVKDYFANFFV